jgi:predicted DNA-binding transcriptional regulator AlpA
VLGRAQTRVHVVNALTLEERAQVAVAIWPEPPGERATPSRERRGLRENPADMKGTHLRLVEPAERDAVAVALATLEGALAEASIESLPDALGGLARLAATTHLRLSRHGQGSPAPAEERLLGVEEAGARLGISSSALYKKADEFPFTVRHGRSIRFSDVGISAWIRKRAR